MKYGIVNIIGFERNDIAYKGSETKNCHSKNCVQVQLKIGNYLTKKTGKPQPTTFGNANSSGPYKGYVISIGTIYSPQLPWYFSHQCSGHLPGNVCYEDYYTDIVNTYQQILNSQSTHFPETLPWYMFNHDVSNRCPKGKAVYQVQLVALDLKPLNKTTRMFDQDNDNVIAYFNQALTQSTDNFKFPWITLTPTNFKALFDLSILNLFISNFDKKDYRPISNAEGPSHFIFPSKCTLGDLASNQIETLRSCGTNYEIHHGGFLLNAKGDPQWSFSQYLPILYSYSRTTFMYAGVSGEAMRVSLKKFPDGLTTRKKMRRLVFSQPLCL